MGGVAFGRHARGHPSHSTQGPFHEGAQPYTMGGASPSLQRNPSQEHTGWAGAGWRCRNTGRCCAIWSLFQQLPLLQVSIPNSQSSQQPRHTRHAPGSPGAGVEIVLKSSLTEFMRKWVCRDGPALAVHDEKKT